MLWNLVKGVVVLACEVTGLGVIPAALVYDRNVIQDGSDRKPAADPLGAA
jgi:hypothetical protein